MSTADVQEALNIRIGNFGRVSIARWVGDPNLRTVEHARRQFALMAANNGPERLQCMVVAAAKVVVPKAGVYKALRQWLPELRQQCEFLYCFFEGTGPLALLLRTSMEAAVTLAGLPREFIRVGKSSPAEGLLELCRKTGVPAEGVVDRAVRLELIPSPYRPFAEAGPQR